MFTDYFPKRLDLSNIELSTKSLGRLKLQTSNDFQAYLLFVLCIAKKNDKISAASYKGQMKALRNKLQLNFKKSYHCKINNTWYNDETNTYIFKDIARSFDDLTITAKDLVESIMYLTNKNHNYAIDYLWHMYLKFIGDVNIFTDKIEPYGGKFLNDCISVSVVYDIDTCCPHCCKSTRIVNHFKSDKSWSELLRYHLQTAKTGDLSKIPKIQKDASSLH